MTGFDDLALATAVEPELTTVRLPAEQVGERGMSALLAVLDGRPPEEGGLPGAPGRPRLVGARPVRVIELPGCGLEPAGLIMERSRS